MKKAGNEWAREHDAAPGGAPEMVFEELWYYKDAAPWRGLGKSENFSHGAGVSRKNSPFQVSTGQYCGYAIRLFVAVKGIPELVHVLRSAETCNW